MTNEQIALQEAVKYITTYYGRKFAIDSNMETETILEFASIFNKHLYKMRSEYEESSISERFNDVGPN